MKAGEIYSKTMPFVWAKLLLGVATVVISAVLLGILIGIALLIGSDGAIVVMLIIWLICVGFVRFVIMRYFGYLVKAGHIAVISVAVMTGRIPENQVTYGKNMVKERFAASNVFFAVDKLVAGAVKQIQKGIGKLGDALRFIPGMQYIAGLAQFFVELSLGYVDECCLGYTFYKKDQGAFKSAADGVVIYAQNWKVLLASAAKTMLMVISLLVAITLVLFVMFGALLRAFNLPDLAVTGIALTIALLLALAIKSAFIDSFVLVRTMVAYMSVAPSTVITFDLYSKLSGISGKFRKLWEKGSQEQPMQQPMSQPASQPAYAAAGGYGPVPSPDMAASPDAAAGKPVYCGQCGAPNTHSGRFCQDCGSNMF